jgi:hypothetical protein
VKGNYVAQITWKARDVVKPLNWKGQGIKFGLYFNDHSLWWTTVLHEGKTLAKTTWLSTLCFSKRASTRSQMYLIPKLKRKSLDLN